MITLSQRQNEILRVIVHEYTQTVTPVSSKAIMKQSNLGVSSATIRNEMVLLEELGLLNQPHTSAGRMPTEAGFRYYVENLMEQQALPSAEQRTISHQFHQARLELDQWLRLSAAVLANGTQNAALVTAPKSDRCRLKAIDLVSLQEAVALLIIVLQGGTLKQRLLTLDKPFSQPDLTRMANRLTDAWLNADAATIAGCQLVDAALAAQLRAVTVEMMQRIDSRHSSDFYHAGLLNILEQPEFKQQAKLRQQIIRTLEERRMVEQLADEAWRHDGIQVIIGGEDKWNDLSQVSIVLSRYGIDNKITGMMGVVGPIRMPYGRSVSVVRYMSGLMSNLISNLYGM